MRLSALSAAAAAAAILPIGQPALAAATRYQAETATISQGAVESNHSGYTGTGFVNNGTTLTAYTALVTGVKKNRYHNGGRLAFGPDGYLYGTTWGSPVKTGTLPSARGVAVAPG
jgi:glucose/arabinose dehydrogenase